MSELLLKLLKPLYLAIKSNNVVQSHFWAASVCGISSLLSSQFCEKWGVLKFVHSTVYRLQMYKIHTEKISSPVEHERAAVAAPTTSADCADGVCVWQFFSGDNRTQCREGRTRLVAVEKHAGPMLSGPVSLITDCSRNGSETCLNVLSDNSIERRDERRESHRPFGPASSSSRSMCGFAAFDSDWPLSLDCLPEEGQPQGGSRRQMLQTFSRVLSKRTEGLWGTRCKPSLFIVA